MIKARWMLLAGLLLVGSLAFAACGGDGDDDDDGDNGSTTPAAGQTVDGGGDDGGDDGDGGDGNGGSDNGEGSRDELLELAEKFVDATFKAVYDTTGAEGFGDGTITIYKDGEDRLRFDFAGVQDGVPFEGSLIESPDGTFLCFSGEAAAVFGSADGVCIESDPDDPTNPVGGITDDFEVTEEDLADTTIVGREEREIAGQDAICYTTTSPDTTGNTVVCISDDGVLLSVENEGSGFTATSVEGSPSDSDFEAPYEVQEIPGLPGQ
jgi:hypothetical protein